MHQTRSLPVRLTDREVQAKGEEVAALVAKIGDVEAHRQEVTKVLKADLDALEERVRKLAYEIRSRSEQRPVEVTERSLSDRAVVELYRLDSLEVVEARPMTAAELADARQVRLFDAKAKPKRVRKTCSDPTCGLEYEVDESESTLNGLCHGCAREAAKPKAKRQAAGAEASGK